MNTRLACQECGAALAVGEAQKTASCPYCASPSVIERPPSPDAPRPEFVVGFSLGPDVAREHTQRWLAQQSLFTETGVRTAKVDSLRGIYLPAYLYSGLARTRYRASIGENYPQQETYWATNSQGKRVRRTRTVIKTEWRPLSGERAEYVTERVVTASRGVPNRDLEAIEPFDLRALGRYDPALLSGWLAEEPSMSAQQCWELARREALSEVGARLSRFMPGDSHRDLAYESSFERESAVLVMLPVWAMALRYRPDKPVFRLLINAQSGRVFGVAPRSRLKVALAIGAVVLFFGGLVGMLLLVLALLPAGGV